MIIGLGIGVGLVSVMAALALTLAIRSGSYGAARDDDGFYDDYTGRDY